MKEQKCKDCAFWIIVILLLVSVIAAFVSDTVRHWLHEAFCYVFWSAIGLIPIVLFFLVPSPEQDRRDRSRKTVDWEMEQDRLKEQAEEEEWINKHK